jgi:diguanylate cyclase (GGDEF)-like protein
VATAYAGLQLRFRYLLRQRQILQREVELRTAEIREAQATDSLTRLLTRGEAQSRLVAALAQTGRTSQIIIGLLDIDHFKRINDRFGHLVGDEILKEMGRRLRLELKPGEYAGRYGGEEILIVIEAEKVPDPDRIQALNSAMSGEPFHADGMDVVVTCSIGVAYDHRHDDWKSLIGRADKALYQAKADGRDRIIVSTN